MDIKEIIFDEEDKTLFLINDLQLKADAIRFSIRPKLEIINNEIISRIAEVYDIDFYKHYATSKAPQFRLSKNQRKEATKTDYTYSEVSITGQRKDNKWLGLTLRILPIKSFLIFFQKNADLISGLASKAKLNYDFEFIDVFLIKEDLALKLQEKEYYVEFKTTSFEYPIDYKKINKIIYSNILFFPVINACVNVALGGKPKFEADILKLENKIDQYLEKYFNQEDTNKVIQSLEDIELYKQRAEVKIKVQTGLRWQVFKRDNWKCLACGRRAEDNVILHIDHIIPRSKGGKDEIENYQTMCDICNIGKSNKDNTDLRR